jgi:uroporphyrinogen-III decarboxylase
MPGKELGDDDMWQILEKENMQVSDYEDIINNGFEGVYNRILAEKCGDPDKHLGPFFEYLPTATQRYADAGMPCYTSFILGTPFELFCGGRSLERFFIDLMDIPDLVEEASKVAMEYQMAKYDAMLAAMKPMGVWVGGWRGAPYMLSMEIWERFVWPYIKKFAELVLSHGVTPIFHLDSNWDRGLEHFREMTEKKCIMGLDSKTDIRLAKKVLGDKMCILGDVPPELLAFGTAEAVFDHATALISDIGPTGYILASGCDVPSNAKKENVKAMREAALKYNY